jgi:hypothetical protein
MGRPLNKKYFGNRDEGKVGGFGVASVTLGGTNNSTGYTNGSAAQLTFGTPGLPNGVTTTGKLVTYAAGALTNATTFTTATGTKAAANITSKTVSVKSTSGSGTGATFSITTTGGAASYSLGSNVTVTLVAAGSGYATTNTITIDGADMGGVTSTNDFTFTLATFVATTGTISSITITDQGSGYITAPTATLSVGTQGTLTVTSVLTTSGVATGSTTGYRDVTIRAYAFLTGGSRLEVDIIKQVSTRRFKVTDGTRTGICTLKNANSAAAGDMDIIANDASSGTYYATKITKNRVTLKQGTGSIYTDNASVPWTFGTATATVAKVLSRG